jgi:uncharacterized protein
MTNLLPARFNHRYRLSVSFALGLVLSLALAVLPLLPATGLLVIDVPNPRVTGGGWVTDLANVLSPNKEDELNQLISAMEARSGTEIAVVTVFETQPSPTPKTFAKDLFNRWGIGKQELNNGVLFLVSKDERRTEVEVGSGITWLLPNEKINEILKTQVSPQFKQENFDAGIVAGVQAIITTLDAANSPAIAAAREAPEADFLAKQWLINIAAVVCLIFLMGAIWLCCCADHHVSRTPRDQTYDKDRYYHNDSGNCDQGNASVSIYASTSYSYTSYSNDDSSSHSSDDSSRSDSSSYESSSSSSDSSSSDSGFGGGSSDGGGSGDSW